MATANMILRISTMADLAGLKAGLDMLRDYGAKVLEVINAVDGFSDAHSRLSLDVSQAIAATKGLIDAQTVYEAANRLSAAGINATAEQLEGLSKKAVEYAQATGQQIPAALEQMTSAVIHGSERGLRQFGVRLDEGTDKTEAAYAALRQFSEQMAETSIQVDSVSNMLDALGNNMGDAAKRIAELSSVSKLLIQPLFDLNEALSQFNSIMEAARDPTEAFFNVLKGTGIEAARAVLDVFSKMLVPLEKYIDVITAIMQQVANIVGIDFNFNWVTFVRQAIADARKSLADVSSEFAGELSAGAKQGSIAGGMAATNQAWNSARGFTYKKPGGGGGSRGGGRSKRGGEPDMTFSGEEAESYYDADLSDLIGPETSSKYAFAGENVDNMQRQEGAFAPPMTDAEADKSIAAMTAWLETRRALVEQEISFAKSFKEAWGSALNSTNAGAMTAISLQNSLRGAMTLVANAAFNGAKVTVKAVADMVKGIAIALGIESSLKALYAFAEAIMAAAKKEYDVAAEFAAAGAEYTATAAIAFAVAGGAAAIGGRSTTQAASSVTGTRTGGGSYGSPGYANVNGNNGGTNVTIVLEGEAGDIFRVVKTENTRRSYSGQESFSMAS